MSLSGIEKRRKEKKMIHDRRDVFSFNNISIGSITKLLLIGFVISLSMLLLFLISQNMEELKQWNDYSIKEKCYISQPDNEARSLEIDGGRLATNPKPKEWSCSNGLKFTRY
ncbi:hypothetical protein [Pantoea sp. X85]|uniref:hypothetical protein n=1 Tax=Pantoea sp. X85 TaxID=3037258 RepID=UPI0024133DA3|nr:hypothetical protein [Pantoea sp. X85]WFL66363.1 hypothetical protein P6287_13400 [Pantoea sp. X85]